MSIVGGSLLTEMKDGYSFLYVSQYFFMKLHILLKMQILNFMNIEQNRYL